MRCPRKADGKTRMDKIRNKEIRRQVNMQPAEQTANKNKIRWWPTASQCDCRALVIQSVGRRPRGRPQNRWEDDTPKWNKRIGIPMIDTDLRLYKLNADEFD